MKIILDYATDTELTTKTWRAGMLLFGISDRKMRFDQDGGVSTVFDIGAWEHLLPSNGIPLENLEPHVQNLLGLADTALQSFTETDPTVPDWAKAENKPTYTASEVGAATASHTHSELEAQVFAVNSLVSNLEFVKNVAYNSVNGDVTFTYKDNSTLTVNVFAENLAQDIDYDAATKELVITKQNGVMERISIADLVDVYIGSNGTHIQVTVGANNVINAVLKAGSVSETELTSALLTKINGKLDSTAISAWAKATNKPSYTASEVGAAATSHTHTKSQVTDFAHTHAGSEVTSAVANATTAASCSGNAATATKLQTARTIGGVNFDGSANINLPGVNAAGNQNTTGTATNATNLTGNVSVTFGTTESTTKFVSTAISQTLATWLQQIGQRINGIIQALGGKANLASPTFTGTVKVPSKTTAAANDGTLVATEAQVANHSHAASTITAGTFGSGDFAFPANVTIVSNLRLKSSANYGNKLNFGDGDYVYLHEITDDKLQIRATNYVFLGSTTQIATANSSGFAFEGTPTAPTAATATNNTQIATTAFVRSAITQYAPSGGGGSTSDTALNVTVNDYGSDSGLPISGATMSLRDWLTTIRSNVAWLINEVNTLKAGGGSYVATLDTNSAQYDLDQVGNNYGSVTAAGRYLLTGTGYVYNHPAGSYNIDGTILEVWDRGYGEAAQRITVPDGRRWEREHVTYWYYWNQM